MIYFNGVSSDDLGLIVEKYPARPIPKRKEQTWSVPGRSGDVLATEDAWENVTRVYDCYISAEFRTGGLQRAADAIAQWLQTASWGYLWDDCDNDCYVVAHYAGPVDIGNIINKFGRVQLKFNCWPQRFLSSGQTAITLSTSGETITNPTGMNAQPLITLHGGTSGGWLRYGTTGTGNDPVIIFNEFQYNWEGVILDSREQEASRDGVNLNRLVTGAIPTMGPGVNYFSWDGGITGITVTPRWWRL